MMYWGTGMGGWAMMLMVVSNLLFWGLILAGILVLVRFLGRDGQPASPAPTVRTAQQILAERLARGEIDEDEYVRRLGLLGGAAPVRGPGG